MSNGPGMETLARSWIHYELTTVPSERTDNWWAVEAVIDFVVEGDGDPDSLWQFILTVHKADRSDSICQVLSAGPLEDLLANFGERYINLVEEQARIDPAFARLLGGVWRNSMSEDVWASVQAVWDRSGWDGVPE
jgi:hypothetical protein